MTARRKPARGGGGQSSLTRETVVAVALAVIERDGLEAFSMRGLSRELGVYPGAVYWHVEDRLTLLGEVTALVVGEIDIPDPSLPWDIWLTELARNYRRVLHRHPKVSPLISGELVSNTRQDFPIAEAILGALRRAGFRQQALVDAYNVVVAMLVGFVGLELAPLLAGDRETWEKERQRDLENVSDEDFPLIAAHRALLANRAFVTRWKSGQEAPLDAAFEAAVDVLVRGLRSKLPAEIERGDPRRAE